MNGTVGKGKKVHRFLGNTLGTRFVWTLCEWGYEVTEFKEVKSAVTCKNCLRILNKKGE